MHITDRDRQLLRDLAAQVAELADEPGQQTQRELWRKHNDLKSERTMVTAYIHDAWPEFFSLEITTKDPVLSQWEWLLRHTIAMAGLGSDELVSRYFLIPYVLRNSDFGMTTQIIHGSGSAGHQAAYKWDPPLKNVEDINKLVRGASVDLDASRDMLAIANDIFGDILDVRLDGGFLPNMSDQVAFLRGMDQVMLDMYENPGFLHQLMAFIRDENISLLKHAEAEGLLSRYEVGAWEFTDQLPANSTQLRVSDLQGGANAQTFVGVSPSMFDEFLFQYQKPVLAMLGQTSYGCCEPLHDRIEIVARLKNLRRIAISPWADLRVSAEKIQDKYAIYWKPHPAVMAAREFDADGIRDGLREAVQITKGCHLQISMKDVTTTNGHPERFRQWVEIARGVV